MTPEEIVEMTDLTHEEVAAIGEHKHVSEIVAGAAMADHVMHLHKCPQNVQRKICDNIRGALHRDDLSHARTLYATLRQLMREHTKAAHGAC